MRQFFNHLTLLHLMPLSLEGTIQISKKKLKFSSNIIFFFALGKNALKMNILRLLLSALLLISSGDAKKSHRLHKSKTKIKGFGKAHFLIYSLLYSLNILIS